MTVHSGCGNLVDGTAIAHPVIAAIAALVALALATPSIAESARNAKQRRLFMQMHPCPENGAIRGRCRGYVITHITPLCAGGADRWSNMEWQTVADAKVKEREERKLCSRKQ